MNTLKFSENQDPEIIADTPEPFSPDTTNIEPNIQGNQK